MSKIKRYSRKKKFSAYCFDAVVDEVRWPNGERLKRDLIIHPGVSVILPQIDRSHLLLIRQYRYGPDKYLWEIPAGTIDPPESPLACAKREIAEEIGYKAYKWKKIVSCYASPGFNTENIHCFLAQDLVKTEARLEHDEIIEPKIFSFREVRKMVKDRKIQDAKTLVPLLYFLNEKS